MILLGYPRSGNTLMRSLIEAISKRPTSGFQPFDRDRLNDPNSRNINDPIVNHDLPLDYLINPNKDRTYDFGGVCANSDLEPVYHCHDLEGEVVKKLIGKAKMIFMIRSFKECILRDRVIIADMDKIKSKLNGYIKVLKLFDQYPADLKCLFYYEDLIDDSMRDSEVERLSKFIGECNISRRMTDRAVDRSLRVYSRKYGSKTDGKSQIFHSKKVPVSMRLEIDGYVKYLCGTELLEYLNRYWEVA